MKDFNYYLEKIGEIGFVEQALHTLVYVNGLPNIKPSEVVLFENGEMGQVLSLSQNHAEVLILSKKKIDVGTKVVRTNEQLSVSVGKHLLGSTLDPRGFPVGRKVVSDKNVQKRPLEVEPLPISHRKAIDQPLETGVAIVDLVTPLGKGQRELIVGNRKTGKTSLLLQIAYSGASRGMVVVYAAIAKKALDIKMAEEFFVKKGIAKNTIVVSSSSADPAGLVYLTPYTAMTIAEYFRDLGIDVIVILDDLTAHAKYYREITLLARYFPGRSSYPGDIFYLHSRLLERGGNFKVGKDKSASITCIPVAELVMGDLSGYIQTNLMAMTDGHIFYDIDLYNKGRRPPVNPFLSVTRVGRQTQTPLLRDLSRKLTRFLVQVDELSQFMHFGAEVSEETRRTLALGERVTAFFNQRSDQIISLNINVLILSFLWAGLWRKHDIKKMKKEFGQLVGKYKKDKQYKLKADSLIKNKDSFGDLIEFLKRDDSLALGLGKANAG